MKRMKQFVLGTVSLCALSFASFAETTTYECEASNGCQVENMETGAITKFDQGERFVHSEGNYKLSTGWRITEE
jgi:hypothetical protein